MTHRPTLLLVLPLFCAYTLGVASSLAASVLFVRCKSQGHCPAKKGEKNLSGHSGPISRSPGLKEEEEWDRQTLLFCPSRYVIILTRSKENRRGASANQQATAAAAVDVASKVYILYAYILTILAKELTFLFLPVCISF